MQKRSHKLLASALLRGSLIRLPKRFAWAFLMGSIQPDCNPFSYLKGSLHGSFLRGHNFSNSESYIHSRIHALQQRSHWNLWHYYTFGKLTHYLADAFTCAHTPHFSALPLSHHQYECHLRLRLQIRLAAQPLLPRPFSGNLSKTIETLHQQYMLVPSDIDRDLDYILHTASLLSSLFPGSTMYINQNA